VLDRQHRLTSPADFSTATRRGRRAGTRTLVVHLAADRPGDARDARVGLVVGKAVGSAVVRNRVKRRLRHLARERLTVLPAEALVVVRALPMASQATYDALGRDFDVALSRLGCLDPGEATTTTGRPRTGVSR
jgi:ribonuclease P protein component